MTVGGFSYHLPDLVNGYVTLLDDVAKLGDPVAPRGLMTRELLSVTLILPATAPMLPVGTGRGISTKLAALEAVQVVGGYSDPAPMLAVAPSMAQFLNDGKFHGAYGARIGAQVDVAKDRLLQDPSTRRAVVQLWNPMLDRQEGKNNYPCMTELQFLRRRGRLDLHVTARSNDAWHGLAYDCFMFSQLQMTLANEVNALPGTYFHHATSLHLYEEHVALAQKLRFNEAPTLPQFPRGFTNRKRALDFRDARPLFTVSRDEDWYADKLWPEPDPEPSEDALAGRERGAA